MILLWAQASGWLWRHFVRWGPRGEGGWRIPSMSVKTKVCRKHTGRCQGSEAKSGLETSTGGGLMRKYAKPPG